MRSIFDILHKNFQEDQLNSRRFPGFPGGFLNSSSFPGVVDTLWWQHGVVVNALILIDKVALQWAQLLLGWVTVFAGLKKPNQQHTPH